MTKIQTISRRVVIGLCVIFTLIAAPRARASEELQRELSGLAESVLKLMAEENQSTVAIGEFTGDKRFDATPAPAWKNNSAFSSISCSTASSIRSRNLKFAANTT